MKPGREMVGEARAANRGQGSCVEHPQLARVLVTAITHREHIAVVFGAAARHEDPLSRLPWRKVAEQMRAGVATHVKAQH